MKSTTSLTLLSSIAAFAVVFVSASGCSIKTEESLSTDDELLQADQEETDEVDDTASSVLDDTTDGTNGSRSLLASGELEILGETAGAGADGGEVDPSADPAQQADRSRTNAGVFFRPAGCLTSTVDGNVVTHVFNDCTGPRGKAHISGTVKATWTRSANSIQVVRATEGDFKINGATITRSATVTFSKTGDVYSKVRVVEMSGSTEAGKTFSRSAQWTVTYDSATKCLERDGSSNSELKGTDGGQRSAVAEVKDLKVCGRLLACPEAGGSISLARTKSKEDKTKTRSLVIEYLGAQKNRVTFTNAKGETKVVERTMICRG